MVGEPGPPTLPPRPPVFIRGRIVGVGGQSGGNARFAARACSFHTRLRRVITPQHRVLGPCWRRHAETEPAPSRWQACRAAVRMTIVEVTFEGVSSVS